MLNKALRAFVVLVVAAVAWAELAPCGRAMAQDHSAVPSTSVAASQTAPKASQQLPEVRDISIKPGADGAALIDIATTHKIPYRTMRLENPPRLVVDFEGAHNAVGQRSFEAGAGIVSDVRVAQWRAEPSAVVRVVADLAGAARVGVHQQPWGVQVELQPRKGKSGGVSDPDPFAFGSGARDLMGGRVAAAVKGRSPSAELPVHQFAELSASLTAPAVPPRDRLIPVLKSHDDKPGLDGSEKLALVSGISIKSGADGKTLVEIASSQSVPYRVFQLSNPPRLVIDLRDARDASHRGVYSAASPVLKRVRIGQWRSADPSVVRIVADLEGSPLFDVYAKQPGVRIDLEPRSALGALARNPFEFERQGPSVKVSPSRRAAAYSPSVRTAPAKPTGEVTLSDLKVLGYVDKPEIGTEAIISDAVGIYFVPEGSAFEDRFRLLKIAGKAVEIEDLNTHRTAWLEFTP